MFIIAFKDSFGTQANLLVRGDDTEQTRDAIKTLAWEAVHEHGWYDDESYNDWTAEQVVDKIKSGGYDVDLLPTHEINLQY
ncbi:MAG: hypothetical protein JSS66_05860 [Armatimonadetes bacterium]|nr:hypothetical protein [Armatimonadota bacterium]